MKLYFDIETGPAPEAEREFARPTAKTVKMGNLKDPEKMKAKVEDAIASWEGKCALNAEVGQVLVIGYAVDDGEFNHIDAPTEAEILRRWWAVVNEPYHMPGDEITPVTSARATDKVLCGHNIINFDLPFLIRRSWINEVHVPLAVIHLLQAYTSPQLVDTMKVWALYNRKTMISLKNLCGAFGVPVKESPVDPALFYKWWADDPDECLNYLRQDVEATRMVAKFMGV